MTDRGADGDPEQIGRYRVREVLGTGGFATVYRATDEHLDVDVAIKVLAENHSLNPDVRRRFIEEARRLRRFRNPHLVQVHDLGETGRAQPYIVLDWADRGDLAKRVEDARNTGWWPAPDDVAVLARALAEALGTLHGRHIVHRDLAPGNLLLAVADTGNGIDAQAAQPPYPPPATGGTLPPLVGPDEQVMLADLGLSKDLAAVSGLTVAAGTSGFAPPEQRDPAGTVDQRADVWAATALVVWLLLGHPPNEGGQWRRELRDAGWPAGFIEALGVGLQPQPERRYPNIDAWRAALDLALPGAGLNPGGATPATSGLRRRRHWWLRAATAIAMVAGGVLGARTIAESPGPTVTTEQLDDGHQRRVVEQHGVTIELEGPTEAETGRPARLSVEVTGTDTWQWVTPDGAVYPNQATVELVPGSAGKGTARVLAVDEQGRIVEAEHDLDVAP